MSDAGYRRQMTALAVVVLGLGAWLLVRHLGPAEEVATPVQAEPETAEAPQPAPGPEPTSEPVAASQPTAPAPSEPEREQTPTPVAAPEDNEAENSAEPPTHVIAAVVQKAQPNIRRCFEKHTKRGPKSGKVVVRFTITEQGRVPQAAIDSSTIGHGATEACIVHAFKVLHFPPRLTPAVVKYPILFEAP